MRSSTSRSDTPQQASRDATGLLDTSAVLLLPRLRPQDLPDQPVISAITLGELSVGPLAAGDDLERARRQQELQDAEADFDPLPFDAACARRFGTVGAALRAAGRKPQARALDALIAATALAHSLPLYTANARDFQEIPGLVVRPVGPASVALGETAAPHEL